jgi:hypothetical protein
MDLGIVLTDVMSNASTTLVGFGVIIAAVIGIKLAVSVAKKFLPK